jgi:hypothetical protein
MHMDFERYRIDGTSQAVRKFEYRNCWMDAPNQRF